MELIEIKLFEGALHSEKISLGLSLAWPLRLVHAALFLLQEELLVRAEKGDCVF